MIAAPPDTLAGLRNRALLLLGFAGALRRSELVGLDVEDLDLTSAGFVVTLRRSKTGQDGDGRKLGVRLLEGPALALARPRWRCGTGRTQ